MATLPYPQRLAAMQPYALPDPNSNKANNAQATVAISKIAKQEVHIQNSSTTSILAYSTHETTTRIAHPPHSDIAPSEISEDSISVLDSSTSVLTFSTCESADTITQLRHLGLGDEASEEEEVEDCISFQEQDWKRVGMTPSREPNERYEGGAKDNLMVGRAPAGLVGAARGSGRGGEDHEGSPGGGSGEGGRHSGGNGDGDGGNDDPVPEVPMESPIPLVELPKSNPWDRLPDRRTYNPGYLEALFSVSTTSRKPAWEIQAEIQRVLKELNLSYRPIRGGFYCRWWPSVDIDLGGSFMLDFDILVLKVLPLMRLHGVHFNKLTGNKRQFKNMAEQILKELRL